MKKIINFFNFFMKKDYIYIESEEDNEGITLKVSTNKNLVDVTTILIGLTMQHFSEVPLENFEKFVVDIRELMTTMQESEEKDVSL